MSVKLPHFGIASVITPIVGWFVGIRIAITLQRPFCCDWSFLYGVGFAILSILVGFVFAGISLFKKEPRAWVAEIGVLACIATPLIWFATRPK